MNNFTYVDLDTWHRADLYRHYTEVWPTCLMTFNITLNVTNIVNFTKSRSQKTAPAFYYLIAKTLCEQSNFCMGFDDGRLGCWSELCPLYPVQNSYGDIAFHSAGWSENYQEYYSSYIEEAERNADCTKAVCGELPKNYVLISILPFMSFDSCSFSLRNAKGYLSPTLFLGKYVDKDNSLFMPLSFTFNHAVADGSHAQRFFDSIQKKFDSPQNYLEG